MNQAFVDEIEAALPTLLDDMKAMGAIGARVAELRAALAALPPGVPDRITAPLRLALLQVELASAALESAQTGKLQALVRDLEQARKRAGKAG